MTDFHPVWLEGQRQRFMRHDAHMFIRPDWRRYVKPGHVHDHRFALIERKAGLERARMPSRSVPWPARDVRQMSREEWERHCDIRRVRWHLAAWRVQLAFGRYIRALKYNPDQPRVPAGSPDGRQWTSEGIGPSANIGLNDPRIISDVTPGNVAIPGARYAQNTVTTKIPPGVSVDQNIKEAAAHKADFISRYLWFHDQVNNGGPWDYKRLNSEYEDFGNFNYGATGKAAGFSEATLLRAAGWKQVQDKNSRPE
jgi:Bacterial toxin 44